MDAAERTTPPTAASASASSSSGAKKKPIKALSKKRLEKHLADAENRGVVYLSRVPPFLKPEALRTMLSGMGSEVLRIYLAPETKEARAGRVRAGGNKKKSFSEGWVEFSDKRRAKRIASTLNSTSMSNNKRSFYAHDLWNIKYLHKFKWHHLTEKIAYEARVRRDKMVAELSAAKKESSFYMRKVEQAKAIDAMEDRKKRRLASTHDGETTATAAGQKRQRDATAGDATEAEADGLANVRRRFKQRRVARDPASSSLQHDERLLKGLLGASSSNA